MARLIPILVSESGVERSFLATKKPLPIVDGVPKNLADVRDKNTSMADIARALREVAKKCQ